MEKTYLITGTSRGLGKEAAEQLLQKGHRVIGLGRSEVALQHARYSYYRCDLADAASVGAVVQAFPGDVKLDGILHNAGLLVNKPFEALTDEDWQGVYAANVMGPARLTRLMLPYCKEGAHVVFVSSMGGLSGASKYPGLAAYSSSKGAVSILAEVLHTEMAGRIVSNALALGAAQTEMLAQAFPGYKAPVSAGEMATFMVWFLEEGGKFFGGQTLPVGLSNA